MSTNSKGASAAKSISIRSLNKFYHAFHALKDLSLEVEAGEFLVLLGPSGCGKSTALRMIAGLESITSGELFIGNTEVTHVLPKYRDIAMVFQSYALYPHKTVAENIGFPLKMAKATKDEIAVAVKAAAIQVELGDYLDRLPGQLSGGQRQRVALARAIIRRPSLFLMDEPLSNLDAKLRGNMRAELKHMQSELGITTIYVTHDQIEAMTLAHRVAVLRDGVLQQLGTPKEVYSDPENLFVAGFMGSPSMNFISGTADDRHFVSKGVKIPVTGLPRSSNITLGFRPEDGRVVDCGEGMFDAMVYTAEMTGDQVLVTMRLGEAQMVIKMPKEFETAADINAGVVLDSSHLYFFDSDTGSRIRIPY